MIHTCAFVVIGLAISQSASAQDKVLRLQAEEGLRRAVGFLRERVATEGGYLWRYSADLKTREGEGKATATQIWVQPPGTPSIGLAFLRAFEATGDSYYRDAARDVARALVWGQLQSGGWDYKIEFDPQLRKNIAYRVDKNESGQNVTTLDDNNTQEAIRLLLRVHRVLPQDRDIKEALDYALLSLVKSQYPNGAWPQRYSAFPEPAKFPIKKASYPENWSRTYPAQKYQSYYTFNDNSISDVVDVLLEALQILNDPRYRQSALKAGEFLRLAQMPEPQPGWAQQYDADMHPAWARKFEPPSITGGEAQGVMLLLLRFYRETGDKKFLEPLPRALAYYRRSLLPDGRLARFYEMRTNRPLYFTKDYRLTYDDSDLPTHYGFKVASKLDRIAMEYDRLMKMNPQDLKKKSAPARPSVSEEMRRQVRDILGRLDKEGRWVEEGKLRYHGPDDPTRQIIDCQTILRGINGLSAYLAASKP